MITEMEDLGEDVWARADSDGTIGVSNVFAGEIYHTYFTRAQIQALSQFVADNGPIKDKRPRDPDGMGYEEQP